MLPDKRVLLVALGDSGEALALRGALEQFHVHVDLAFIGETRDLISLLHKDDIHDLILLSCHGKDGAILMPELAEPLTGNQPFRGSLTPQRVREHLLLRGRRVLCLGCSTGDADMGRAFLDAGCEWYAAPDGYPNGADAVMFAVHFLYLHLGRGMKAEEAMERARIADDDRGMFQLFPGNYSTST